MIKISIITVCRNVKDKLMKTVESVCHQTYSNIEYVIIDGASTDGTLAMLQEYKVYKNIYVYSESDFGIYNAMNRGITKVSGHYVYFLNAGDILYNEFVIETVVAHIEDITVIYFGKVCLVYADGLKQIQDFDKKSGSLEEKLYRGEMPCHQSIFSPRNALINHKFREEYKMRADFEWLLYSINRGYECKAIPVIISCYDVNGASSRLKNNKLLQREGQMILREYQEKLIKYEKPDSTMNQGAVARKYIYLFQLMNSWMALKQKNFTISWYLQQKNYRRIAIYGMGHMGLRLLEELYGESIEVIYVIDRNIDNLFFDIKAVSPNEKLENVDAIIVTAVESFYEIQSILYQKVWCPIISLEDIIYDIVGEI